MNQKVMITRGHVGILGSVVGGIGLLAAALGVIWQGGITPAIIALLVAGIAGVALWAYMIPQDFRGFITGRQVRQSTVSVFSTLLLTGIVGLTYIMVQRQVIVADMTIDSRFSLSPETQTVLQTAVRTPEKIEITGFYYASDVIQHEIDDGYFQLYEAATNGHIYRRYVNPVEEPAFTARYLDAINEGYYVFISFVDDGGNIIPQSTIPIAITGRQESDITIALRQLLASGMYTIYFDTGLGEPDPTSNLQQGLSTLNNYLETNGLLRQPIRIDELAQTGGTIPQNASAVVIAQPRRDMTPEEVNVLDEYLKRGGALFIAADMFFTDDLFMKDGGPLNEYMWAHYGLRMTQKIAVDPSASGQTALDVVSAAVYPGNEIGKNLNQANQPDTATQFRTARTIEIDEDPPVTNGGVIMTSPDAWAETDLEALSSRNEYTYDPETETRGILTTAAWARDEATNAKIVLVGDGDFLTNGMITSPTGNAILVLDSLGWMSGYTDEVNFAPVGIATTPVLFVDAQTLDLIAFLTVALLPGIMLVLAVVIYVRRLRQ